MTPEERFWAKVDVAGPCACWLWTASTNTQGYGRFNFKGKNRNAHRVVFMLNGWEPPPELVVDHLCRNPRCVNPWHLEFVTQRENIHRGTGPIPENVLKVACPQGHPFDEANTFIRRSGARGCRICIREANRKQRARKRAAA